jgi:hypothetical protein
MRDRRGWLFVVPVVIATAALMWSILQPSEVCSSGGDTRTCNDYSAIKFVVATAGVGLAALLAAAVALATGVRRFLVIVAAAFGVGLIGLAATSQIRSLLG